MTRDRELWACAGRLLADRGDGAEEHARGRMRDLVRAGDDAGADVWAAILDRILRPRAPDALETSQ